MSSMDFQVWRRAENKNNLSVDLSQNTDSRSATFLCPKEGTLCKRPSFFFFLKCILVWSLQNNGADGAESWTKGFISEHSCGQAMTDGWSSCVAAESREEKTALVKTMFNYSAIKSTSMDFFEKCLPVSRLVDGGINGLISELRLV